MIREIITARTPIAANQNRTPNKQFKFEYSSPLSLRQWAVARTQRTVPFRLPRNSPIGWVKRMSTFASLTLNEFLSLLNQQSRKNWSTQKYNIGASIAPISF